MLDNVFNYGEIISYIFTIDYIYNFLQIKLIWNENKTKEDKEKFNTTNESIISNNGEENNENDKSLIKPLLFEGGDKEFSRSEEVSFSLIKLGVNFKKRQKFDFFNLNKQYENYAFFTSSNSHSLNDSYNNYSNFYNKKEPINNKLNNQSQKNTKKIHNDQNNYSYNYVNHNNNRSRRKNTYTFGQGLQRYSYNYENSKIIVNEENKTNIRKSRSNSYDKLGNDNNKTSNASIYKIQLNDSIEENKGNLLYYFI